MDDNSPATETQPAEPTLADKKRAALAKGRATAAANRAAKKAAQSTKAKAPDNAIAASSVQVPGALLTIKDGKGHVWTVPAEDTTDYRRHNSAFELKRWEAENPDFQAQFVRRDEITDYFTKEWVPIERDELHLKDLPAAVTQQYGNALDSFHWVEGSVAMKKPKVLTNREYAGFDRFRKEVANSMKAQTVVRADGTVAVESARPNLDAGGLVTESVKEQSTFREPRATE